jgi:DNA repair exonuclease SbcCD ATPase subunit
MVGIMLSGLQVLGSFDQALLQAQQQAAASDRQVSDLNNRLLQLRKQESEAYRALARVRMSSPNNDQLIQRLTDIDGNVRTALQQRSSATTEVDAEITAIEGEARTLQTARNAATAVVEERRKTLLAAEEATRNRLEQVPAYQQQLQATQRAEQIAVSAEEKTKQAENDRIAKGKPYERDELFQYLWKRGFGTPAYTAGPLTRMMDRWVARLVGYNQARVDYAMLQEIPRRLAEHAARQREQAQAEAQRLTEMQQAALNEGEAAAKRAELAEAEANVDAIDDKIEANGKRAIDAYARRAAITRGEHPAIRTATEVIERALRHEDLKGLRADAQRTSSGEDDAAVRRLEQLEAEEQQLLAAIEQAKADQQAYRRQMAEIESIRRDYRRRGYNRGMFDAAGGALIGSLLGQLLGGALSRDVFWDQIDHHRQSWPGPGDWGGGFGGGGESDFGTGGGFGGDDFRTGGGF